MITNLQAEVTTLRKDLKVEVAVRKVETAARKIEAALLKEDLGAKVDLLMDATIPGLSIILRTLRDAHLMELGFIPHRHSRSQFVVTNATRLAAAMGVPENQVVVFFQYVSISLSYIHS